MIYPLPPLRFEIIRPKMPLWKWYNAQAVKPYLLVNASLYEGARPIGTIIEGGQMVQNAGNGFGFGIMPDGTAAFGDPWRGWRDYITGYYGIVQNGKAVPQPDYDPDVFNTTRPRIAIGQTADGICIATHGGAKIRDFAAHCVDEGLVSCANLDGGGSRFLIIDRVLYHDSARTPYNAIAGYLDENREEEETVRGVATKKQPVYDALGRIEEGRYISKGDVCELGGVTANLLVSVTYPTGKTTRCAFVKSLEGFTRG